MKILSVAGKEDLALVYVAHADSGKQVEFVESLQPPFPREKKWVLIVSALYGCPVGCRICDAGGFYQGPLSKKEIFAQIDHLVKNRFPDGKVPVGKFKIQFARMGEPAYNPQVLDVLEELVRAYEAPGLIVCLSTIAPQGKEKFFDGLMAVKKRHYRGKFQFQYSLHTTDGKGRDWLMPVKKWSLEKMAEYGEAFLEEGDRKIALNFALAEGMPVDPDVLLSHFPPEKFLIKMTPVNPTYRAVENKILSGIVPGKEKYGVVEDLKSAGYEVILSIGELEENAIGSNCGQRILRHIRENRALEDAYTYPLHEIR